jgi:hypothetical protein
MTITSPAAAATADPTQLPGSFLICYEITTPESLGRPVRLYKVVRTDGSGQSHGARGEIKQAIWAKRTPTIDVAGQPVGGVLAHETTLKVLLQSRDHLLNLLINAGKGRQLKHPPCLIQALA